MDPYEEIDKYINSVSYHLLLPGKMLTTEAIDELDDMETGMKPSLQCLQYSNILIQGLKQLQSKKTLSDVTLLVDGKVFHAHRCVLAAVSPYFEALFTSGFQESKKQEIEIKDINCQVFEMILNCAYSGKIMDLSMDIVMDVFHAAVYLQFSHVQNVAVAFLSHSINEDELSLEDAFAVLLVAQEHNLSKLLEDCCKHLVRRNDFAQFIGSDEFMKEGSASLIYRFLRRGVKSPGETNEEQLMFNLNNWLKYSWDERKHHTAGFMKGLRLGCIPLDKVKEVMDASMLQQLPECREILDTLVKNVEEFAEESKDSMQLPESFLPRNMIKTLVSIGGRTFGTVDSPLEVNYYDEGATTWNGLEKLATLPYDYLENAATVVVNGELYIAGGDVSGPDDDEDEDSQCTNRFFKFDNTTYEWKELPSMRTCRTIFILTYFERYIYAVGGKGSEGYLDAVERFNLSTQRWYPMNTLPEPMVDTRAVVLDGQLFVYGLTKLDLGRGSTCALVVLDRVTRQWTKILEEKFNKDSAVGETVILLREGKCYRVWYSDVDTEHTHINQIEPRYQSDGSLTAVIGDKMANSLPKNDVHAFVIKDSLYVNMSGTVHEVPQNTVCDTMSMSMYLNRFDPIISGSSVVAFSLDLSKV